MDSGYIKLHRSMRDWEWYHDLPVYRLFTCMLFMANWKDKRWQGLEVKRGQFVSSLGNLSDETGLTVKQIRRALEKLESTGEVVSKRTNKYSIYTIVNYGSYQDDDRDEGTQKTNKGQAEGTLRANKGQQLKKDKKERKEEKSMSQPFASELVTRWNTLAAEQNLACVKTISKSRNSKISTRVKEGLSMEQFVRVLEEIAVSDFLLGKSRSWKVSFDWLIDNDRNWLKVYEGTYRNAPNAQTPFSAGRFETAQERRQREIKEQEERLLKKFGGVADDTADKTADANARFVEATELFRREEG